jgi:hypothetical protein
MASSKNPQATSKNLFYGGGMVIRMRIKDHAGQMFFSLLREGVDVRVVVGKSVFEILRDDLQIPEDVIQKLIQSLFLDHHPVDDLDTPVLKSGSVLSLSAAMPGLIGACMRRGGAYAGMRQGISWSGGKDSRSEPQTGYIRVKLFNFLAPRIGPLLLSRGVRVEGRRLARVVEDMTQVEREDVISMQLQDLDAYSADMPPEGEGRKPQDAGWTELSGNSDAWEQTLKILHNQESVWLQVLFE